MTIRPAAAAGAGGMTIRPTSFSTVIALLLHFTVMANVLGRVGYLHHWHCCRHPLLDHSLIWKHRDLVKSCSKNCVLLKVGDSEGWSREILFRELLISGGRLCPYPKSQSFWNRSSKINSISIFFKGRNPQPFMLGVAQIPPCSPVSNLGNLFTFCWRRNVIISCCLKLLKLYFW